MAVKLRKQEEVAARTIDLRKKVSLAKERAGLLAQAAQVEFVLDISGSFAGRYRDNTIQDIVERLAPIALEFDADGAMPVTLFGVDAHEAPPITQANLCEYVNREVVKHYPFEGGTKYAKPLWHIVQRHCSAAVQEVTVAQGGWFKKKKTERKIVQQSPAPVPIFVQFITDGDNQDREETEKLLRMMEVLPIFIQFVGAGTASFAFLRKLDEMRRDFIDNASFFQVTDIVNTSDEQLYKDMLHEFPAWLNKAKDKGLVHQHNINKPSSPPPSSAGAAPQQTPPAADDLCLMCKGAGGSCMFCKGTGRRLDRRN
ncbi:TerF vWA domain-containing protein [Candidatus Electronema halotolerans]